MIGAHKKVDDEVHQENNITLNVIHNLTEGLKKEIKRIRIITTGKILQNNLFFYFVSFLGCLGREDTVKLVIEETIDYLEEDEIDGDRKSLALPLMK